MMMHYYWLGAIPLAVGGFVAFWSLIVKLISLTGWRRLANQFQTSTVPPGSWFGLGQAFLGLARYQGVIRGSASPQGLALRVIFPFRVGHPPLLVPWAAIGPVQAEKKF